MAYKVLYRKYRPADFDNVVGQDYTVSMLKNAINTGKQAHAYIFTGPRGTGKTSSAKIFAKALNCLHPVDGNPCGKCANCLAFNDSPDIIEIDAASNNGVDEIRELINNVKLVPTSFKYKVYIIDEVHMLTASAFNALLLTLEEPPSHVVFILATTDIQDVPITILSRCQRFDFKPVSMEALTSRLKYVCTQESIDITDDAINEIALISAGGMRDALGMLDQLSSNGEKITMEMVSSYFGSVSVKKIDELLTALSGNNCKKLLELLETIRKSGTNYSVFVEKLVLALRKYAIDIKTGSCNKNFTYEEVYNLILDLNECLCNININIDPYVLIEIVLMKYIRSENDSIQFLGNNLGNKQSDVKNYFPGNNLSEKKSIKEVKSSSKKSSTKSIETKRNQILNNISQETVDPESIVIPKVNIDIKLRVNNCFYDCSKDLKRELVTNWNSFINYARTENGKLFSLIADTEILAASSRYALIQSSIDSTNQLINENIGLIEVYYEKFTNKTIKFCALNKDLWEKEKENYGNNIKNGIKYEYIDEPSFKEEVVDVPKTSEDKTIDDLKDMFGSIEVE